MSASGRIKALAARVPVVLIAAYGAAKLLQLATAVAIARAMPKDDAGAAFYLIGLIAFNSVVAALGLDTFSSYLYPRMKRAGRLHQMWPYIIFAMLVSIPVGLVISLPIFFEQAGRSFEDGLMLVLIAVACTAASVFRRMARTAFLGAGQRLRSILHESAVNSSLLIALLVILPVRSPTAVGLVLLLSHIGAAGATWWDIRRALPPRPSKRPTLPRWRAGRVMLMLAAPSLISQASAQLLNRADVLILAPLSDAVQVSNYSVAIRVAFFLQAIIELTNFIYGARILAANDASRERQGALARMLIVQTGLLTLALSMPILIAPAQVLSLLFGQGYSDAAPVLRLLTLGKLLTAPFGPILTLFVVLGQNRKLAWIVGIAAAINICIDLAAIPKLGALGAAIGSFAALAFMAMGYCMLYLRLFGRAAKGSA